MENKKPRTLEDELNASPQLNISEKGELAQTFENLDKDVPDEDGFSTIDMNTILSGNKVSAVTRFDTLIRLGIMPKELASLSKSIKRLSVSQSGTGRAQKVTIAEADRSQKSGSAGMGKLARMFSPRP